MEVRCRRCVLSRPMLPLPPPTYLSSLFAQSKNHTGRNAVHKDHANRIKKASRYQTKGLKGVSFMILRLLASSLIFSTMSHPVDGSQISAKSSLLKKGKQEGWKKGIN